MVKITKNVGKNCFQQLPCDVEKVQTCLKSLKGARFQSYYQGKLDGICGKKTIAAIECFQLMNNIRVTGKVEQVGPTLSRLTQKTSGSVQNKLKSLPMVSKDNPRDRAKINANNQKTAETIKSKSPLPKAEANALADIIISAGKADGVPLDLRRITLDSDRGKFVAILDIPNWALPQTNEKEAVISAYTLKVSKHVGKHGKWQVGGNPKFLVYATTQPFGFLKGGVTLKPDVISKLGLSGKLDCPVTKKCVDAVVKKAEANEKENDRELASDAQSTISAVVEWIWEANTQGIDIPEEKIFKGLLKGVDLLFLGGKIYIQVKEGKAVDKVFIGELSSFLGGWSVSIGAGAIVTVGTGGNALWGVGAGILAGIAYSVFGGDEIVAKNSLKAYLTLQIEKAKTEARWNILKEEIRRYISRIYNLDKFMNQMEHK